MRTVAVGLMLLVALVACAAPEPTPTVPPGVSVGVVEYADECVEATRRYRSTLVGVGEEDYEIRLRAAERMVERMTAKEPPPDLALYHEAFVSLFEVLIATYELQIDAERMSAGELRSTFSAWQALTSKMEAALEKEEEAQALLSPALRAYIDERCL